MSAIVSWRIVWRKVMLAICHVSEMSHWQNVTLAKCQLANGKLAEVGESFVGEISVGKLYISSHFGQYKIFI
jgi:hypothetical protein